MIGRLLRRILYNKSTLAKNTSYLIFGTIIAQIIAVGLLPILSRSFDASDFGYLGQVIAILAILTPVVTWSFSEAILGAKSDKDASGLIVIACGVTAVTSLLIYIGINLIQVYEIGRIPSSENFDIIIAVGSLITGLSSVSIRCLLFTEGVTKLAVCLAAQTAFSSLLPVFATLSLSNTQNYLIYGFLSGHIVTIILCQSTILKIINSSKSFSLGSLVNTFAANKNYALYTTPSQIATAGVVALPVFGLSWIHGATTVGLYVVGQKLMGGPITILSKAISQAYASEVIKVKREGNSHLVYARTKKIIVQQLLIGIPVLMAVSLGAYFLYVPVLGDAWEEGNLYPLLLVPMFALKIPANTLGSLFSIFQLQKLQLYREIIRGVILVGVLIILYLYTPGILFTVGSISMAAAIGYIVYIAFGMVSIKGFK